MQPSLLIDQQQTDVYVREDGDDEDYSDEENNGKNINVIGSGFVNTANVNGDNLIEVNNELDLIMELD